MQTAGKRPVDSMSYVSHGHSNGYGGTAAACRPEEERRAGRYLPFDRSHESLGHILGRTKVAYSVNPGNIEITRLEVRADFENGAA